MDSQWDSSIQVPSGLSAGWIWNWTFPVRYNFYAVTPGETSFAAVEDVPNYVGKAIPFFIVSILVEYILAWIIGKPRARINDGISSLSAGLLQQMSKLIFLSWELRIYTYLWTNFRLWNLTFDSRLSWWICFLGYDLGYYFAHRIGHEVNIAWAAHQVHHSSEEYNLTTALRQSVFQSFNTWFCYTPLALLIPPTHFLVHAQFNLLYQFWIHTEVIDSLGPLEWVLNTPSHHRVHHGRNRYCIDRNYAGVLIIWDRMFGTFEPEDRNDPPVYGLVYVLNTWNPIYVQMCHYKYMFWKFWETEGLVNKVSFIFKGPSWSPGKPRLGYVQDLPDVHYPQEKFDQSLPKMFLAYVVAHFLLTAWLYERLALTVKIMSLSSFAVYGGVGFLTLSLTSFGLMFDHRLFAPAVELLRVSIAAFVMYFIKDTETYLGLPPVGEKAVFIFFLVSTIFWLVMSAKQLRASIAPSAKKFQ